MRESLRAKQNDATQLKSAKTLKQAFNAACQHVSSAESGTARNASDELT